jgi:hypothetical protein
MASLEVKGVERSDRFRVGNVWGRWPLRRHTLARRARGGIGLAKNLSLEPCSAKLQVEPPPRASWQGNFRRNMRGDLV